MSVAESVTVFSDESAVCERYLAFGGIFVNTDEVAEAEEDLEAFAMANGFGDRELSWKKCSKGEVARYADFAATLWDLDAKLSSIDFRSLLVDTHNYPLKDLNWSCASDEDGFYRFYHFFITRSLARVAPKAKKVALHVAATSDQYPFRTEILSTTVRGGLRKVLDPSIEVTELKRSAPRGSRLHQLADVLVGAVTFRWNMGGRASTKAPIADRVESLLGQQLDVDIKPSKRPFNVWTFTRLGQRRWTKGARGTV